MKKILILVFALLIAFGLPLSVCAETGETISLNTYVPEGETEGSEPADQQAFDTILTRLYEWWENSKTEIVSIAAFIGTFVLTFLWNKIKKYLTDIISKILSLVTSTNNSTDNIKALIKGYNGQTDKITSLEGQIIEYKDKLDTAYKKLEETEVLVGHIAHILTTVYTNSVLPQGVKDMVNVECAMCMKIVDLPEAQNENET